MNYILIVTAILIFTVQGISFKEFSRSYMRNFSSYLLFNFFYFSIVALTMLFLKPDFKGIHIYTSIFAACFGLLFIATMLFYMKAMESGLFSYTTLIFSFGITIPIIFGALLWKEEIGIVQSAGLSLLFVTFYIGNRQKNTIGTI
jgi:drug/metabolite transporter (DMT)-like permease